MRIAAHSGASIRSISQVVEHARLLPGVSMRIQNGCDIPLKGIGFPIGTAQMMFILTHIPGKRSGGIGVSKQFANICWCHPHFAHPGGGGCSCSMGGNAPNDICLADSSELAEEGDRGIIEEGWPHTLIAILEKVVRRLVRFAIWERLLVRRSHTFPHFNSISGVRGNRYIKLPSHFVGRHPQIAEFFGRFHLLPLFVTHFWDPFPAHASDAQPPDLIHSSCCCDPY